MMDDIVSTCNSELSYFLKNDEDLIKFFQLIKKFNPLDEVTKQSRTESRCLYEAISKGLSISILEQTIEDFFTLQKPSGTNLPVLLKFNKTVRMLSGVRKDQSFFMKKVSVGEIYGALWPWQSEPQNITILLGLNGEGVNNADYQELEKIVDRLCI